MIAFVNNRCRIGDELFGGRKKRYARCISARLPPPLCTSAWATRVVAVPSRRLSARQNA